MSGGGGEDIVDASSLTKKEHVLDRLNKRNKDRQNYLDSKNEQKLKYGLQVEGVDYFSQTFNERVHEISLRIQNVSDAASKKISGDSVNPDLKRIFADITMEIQELERYLTKSTIFLTDYKIKTCQNILNDLTHANEEARVKLIPKKKFGFSLKKNKTCNNANISAINILNEKPLAIEGVVGTATLTDAETRNEKSKSDQENEMMRNDQQKAKDLNKTKNLISNYVDNGATIHNKHDEYICLKGSEINAKDITISSLDNCFVEIQGHLGSLQLHNVNNCVLLCGPVARACFAQYCENTTIAVACQQLRLHTSTTIALYLHVTCRAVIEESRKIKVSAYNYDYPDILADFIASGLDKNINKYFDIADFDWLSPNIPSPNWTLVNENDGQTPTTTWHEMRSKFKERLDLHSSK